MNKAAGYLKRFFCLGIIICSLLITMGNVYVVEASDSSVTSGAVKRNGHYYKLYDKGMTWSKAKKFCESQGGHLVTVTSQGEQNLVKRMIAKGAKNSYWMGGYVNNSGIWKWVTGEKFSYSNWAYNQPDNHDASGYENVLVVYKNLNPNASCEQGEWNDLNADGTCGTEEFFGKSNIGFICEWDTIDDIEKIDLAEGKLSVSMSKVAYTGDAYEPSVTVKWNGITLKKNSDYKVSYSNNISVGKAVVTVTGIGDFRGKLKKSFKIVPQKVKNVSLRTNSKHQIIVTWSRISEISKYELQYSLKSNFSSRAVRTISKQSAKTVLENLKKGKRYYIRIRSCKIVNGTKYYGAWSIRKNIVCK